MLACVELQKEVWGFTDADLIPLRLFIVARKIGGQVLGAFDGNELVGFALAIPGVRGGHAYLHSHMLAVRLGHRNSGVGRRIKLLQREDALARGFELIEWTFDPLEIKNAHLNLERLGAIARRYNINQYGTTASPLHGGLPTDRLVAEWWLRSKRVEEALGSGGLPEFAVKETVTVPAEINDWKSSEADRGRAAAVQERNRELLVGAFSRGLAALGFRRDQDGNGSFRLGKWDEEWGYGSG
ncbi:MAG: GNAT family N-acetyltransferase [Acidobacteriia bacterium]|nr:GNAT family N-acetyltransferase [Terriglobia bacterium]